ncbi:hypothetical protein BDZ89DRAFT_1168955, partial [Hymenopellis radicata]
MFGEDIQGEQLKESQKSSVADKDAPNSRLVENPLFGVPNDTSSSAFTAELDNLDVSGFLQGQSYAPLDGPYPTVGSSSSGQIISPSAKLPMSVEEFQAFFRGIPSSPQLFVRLESADTMVQRTSGHRRPLLSDDEGEHSSARIHVPSPTGALPIRYSPPPGPPPGWPYLENWSSGALAVNSGVHQFTASDITATTTKPKRKRNDSESVAVKGKGKKKAKTKEHRKLLSIPLPPTPEQLSAHEITNLHKKCLWRLSDGSACGHIYNSDSENART